MEDYIRFLRPLKHQMSLRAELQSLWMAGGLLVKL